MCFRNESRSRTQTQACQILALGSLDQTDTKSYQILALGSLDQTHDTNIRIDVFAHRPSSLELGLGLGLGLTMGLTLGEGVVLPDFILLQ